MPNIRTAIGQHVARAIASTKEKDEQNDHNWREITTDRILNEVIAFLPEPVDIQSKYEMTPQGVPGSTLVIDTINQSEEQNSEMLKHAARFADDQGYNRYRREFIASIKELYSPVQNSV